MEFENEFTVPVPPGQAWEALMDMDQVAQCMPGATLLENDGDRFVGKVKVKVGPITVSYKGTAEFIEKDPDARRAVLRGKGREERGAGTAGMTVVATLEPLGNAETQVRVLTDLDITGKPAQFGRGVMSEVGTAIIGQFATRLAQQLTAEETAKGTVEPTPNSRASGAGQDSPASSAQTVVSGPLAADGSVEGEDADALNIGMLAWGPAAKRALPVLAGGVGLWMLARALNRKPDMPTIVVLYAHSPHA